jgi:hypothetical protein
VDDPAAVRATPRELAVELTGFGDASDLFGDETAAAGGRDAA